MKIKPRLSIVVLAVVFASWVSRSAAAADAANRPNILFIAIDDQNDWTGCLKGHPDAKTPAMDRLAARGVLFERAYCPAPHCNPSRASLLSGLRPSTSGVYLPEGFRQAMPTVVTLPQYFMQQGYHVLGAGKIFHQHDKQSWHEYMGKPGDAGPPRNQRPLNGIAGGGQFDWGPLDVSDEDMADGKLARWAVEQLGRRYDKPVFLAVGFIKPHLPWYAPRKYFDLYDPVRITLPTVKEDDLADVPPMGRKFAIEGIGFDAAPGGDHAAVLEHDQWRKAVVAYLATCSFVDAQLARVVQALDESPYAKNTIVVLWSDHGWHLGQKQHWRKHALWEQATRCLLTVSAPGVTAPGGRCPKPVSLIDLYPTLVDLAGLPARDGLEGQSLAPLLKDPAAARDRPAVMTYTFGNHAVRSERWRYIRYSDGTEELYDHENDELEWTNLANRPEFAKVKEDLARWLPKIEKPSTLPPGRQTGGGE